MMVTNQELFFLRMHMEYLLLNVGSSGQVDEVQFIGNMRIEDNTGYEYRTNLIGTEYIVGPDDIGDIRTNDQPATFNFNKEFGVTFSDIVLISFNENNFATDEVSISELSDAWFLIDVDIYDLNENPFSCRNVIFSCVDQDNPLLESLLENIADEGDGSASVASFEYGINDSIPHSKGGELLCPGNNISEGIVRLTELNHRGSLELVGFVGLNNGNGRGSMDSMFAQLGLNPS